jgi:hypothetical protein
MTRQDMIANERHQAALYRREAQRREAKNFYLAQTLRQWAAASERRAEELRVGPLFGGRE